MTSPVMEALRAQRIAEEPSTFGKWCIVRGVRALPTLPAHVANFVRDLAGSGRSISEVWPYVEEISKSHILAAQADPVCGIATEAINAISMLRLPRSWPKETAPMFMKLPYDVQAFIIHRETERDTALRRAQNALAEERKKFETRKGTDDGPAKDQPDENRADA